MHSWDRQPFDTDESFVWFQAFRDALPPRQLGRLRTASPGKIIPPLQVLLDWYTTHFWRDRVADWDTHLDHIRQEEREEIVGQTAKEQAARDQSLIHEARELVSRELNKMLITSMSNDAETLKPGELNKLLENVIKLGRLTRGETTENVGSQFDLSTMTVEDLRKLRELQEKSKKK